jgi:hypothetical protein
MSKVFVYTTDVRTLASELLFDADRKQLVRIMSEEFGIDLEWSNSNECFIMSKEDKELYNLE